VIPPAATAARAYVQEVVGIAAPDLRAWTRAAELPYYLRDAFEFCELEMLGHPVVLAVGRAGRKDSLSDVRTWLAKVRALAAQPTVYVTEALASYERRRLIEYKVPFIVPGNQLYLPDLGLDLREYFRQRTAAAEALSPSTQAMLISALLRQPWTGEWRPTAVARELGYTPMTLSRVVKELTAAGLASVRVEGRSRWLRMDDAPETVWERAKPMLRTPVRYTVWVAGQGAPPTLERRVAGLSALARESMLSEPRWPVYAISSADWKVARQAGVADLPEPVDGAQEWQVWNYSPALVPEAPNVDPLSLTLSLQDNPDERIQLALDELKGRFPW
jgi:DNA-binding MarR family transcriptional regulator